MRLGRLSYRPMSITPDTAEASDADSTRLRLRLQTQFEDASQELLGSLVCCIGNLEDARDAYQETFLKCWRHRDQIDQVADLRAWVFRIAINTGRDYRKTAWNRRRRPLHDDPSESGVAPMTATTESPESALQRREEYEQIRIAVASLREEEREVFLMRQNGELTYEQIAVAMSLPLGTVKTRMRTALSQLRIAVGAQS